MIVFEESTMFWVILSRALLCSISLRIGYIIIQIGESSSTKIQTILKQNLVELLVASGSFFIFGRSIIFNDEEENLIPSDYDDFFDVENEGDNKTASLFYVWTAMISTTTIFTAATAGRMHSFGQIVLTTVIAGFIHPLTMSWTWNSNSFMKDASFLDYTVTYLDSGSFSHVHLLAGTAAMFAAAFLGRDLSKKFNKPSQLTSKHISFGYFLVMLGIIGLTIPLTSPLKGIQPPKWTNFYPKSFESLISNNIIAAIGGFSISSCAQIVLRSKKNRSVVQNLQAALGGMVAASSAIYLFTPLTSLVVGAIGGLIIFMMKSMKYPPLDDHCNVMTTHMVCGIVGSLYPKKMSEILRTFDREAVVNFMWEIVCNLVMHAIFNASLVIVLLVLDKLGCVKQVKKESRRLFRRKGGLVERDEEFGGRFGFVPKVRRFQRIKRR